MSRLHTDSVPIDTALVRHLLAGEFPRWATLPLQRVPSTGTVNALYRLGGDLVIRLPLAPWGVAQLTGKIDTAAATAVWEADLAAPSWEGPPVWIHGDLLPTIYGPRLGRQRSARATIGRTRVNGT